MTSYSSDMELEDDAPWTSPEVVSSAMGVLGKESIQWGGGGAREGRAGAGERSAEYMKRERSRSPVKEARKSRWGEEEGAQRSREGRTEGQREGEGTKDSSTWDRSNRSEAGTRREGMRGMVEIIVGRSQGLKQKQEACVDFSRGQCPRGESCRFLHAGAADGREGRVEAFGLSEDLKTGFGEEGRERRRKSKWDDDGPSSAPNNSSSFVAVSEEDMKHLPVLHQLMSRELPAVSFAGSMNNARPVPANVPTKASDTNLYDPLLDCFEAPDMRNGIDRIDGHSHDSDPAKQVQHLFPFQQRPYLPHQQPPPPPPPPPPPQTPHAPPQKQSYPPAQNPLQLQHQQPKPPPSPSPQQKFQHQQFLPPQQSLLPAQQQLLPFPRIHQQAPPLPPQPPRQPAYPPAQQLVPVLQPQNDQPLHPVHGTAFVLVSSEPQTADSTKESKITAGSEDAAAVLPPSYSPLHDAVESRATASEEDSTHKKIVHAKSGMVEDLGHGGMQLRSDGDDSRERNQEDRPSAQENEEKEGLGAVDEQSKSSKGSKSVGLVRVAVAELVKDVLKPKWKEGILSKESFKVIAKKSVEKVVSAIPAERIPKSQKHVDLFMSPTQREKITKLVQGYVEKYTKV